MDIIIFVEHQHRELPLLKKVADSLAQNTDANIGIFSLIFDAHKLFFYQPKIVVLPYAISSENWPIRLIRKLYGDNVIVVNLSWEQMLFGVMEEYKKPVGQYIKENIYHIAWHEDFKSYLEYNGVLSNNILICGNPKSEDLNDRLITKEKNVKLLEYLQKEKYENNVFFVMNFSWAWHTDKEVQGKINQGFPEDKAWEYRQFAQKNRQAFLAMITELANRKPRTQFIIRPHPSISVQNYQDSFRDEGLQIPDNVLINQEFSAYDWLTECDFAGSSWSTVCVDAAYANIPSFFYAPFERPKWMDPWWINIIPNLSTIDQIIDFINKTTHTAIQKPIEAEKLNFSQNLSSNLKKIYQSVSLETKCTKKGIPDNRVLLILAKRIVLKFCIPFGIRPGKKPDLFNPIIYSSSDL